MANITIRNIPESVFAKLKMLAEIDRRSLNNELLVAIECGVRELEFKVAKGEVRVTPEVQSALWGELAGNWKDKRSKAGIHADLRKSRTMGRDVDL
jgi:hypothetical protein